MLSWEYFIMFNLIKTTMRSLSSKKIAMDFELAAIQGIKKVISVIIYRECYYHFNLSLWRKAAALQIKTRLKKKHVARCVGFARLPKKFLNAAYQYVMGKSPVSEETNKFNKYFNKKWIYKDEILKYCCCENEHIQTNNNIEGWHTKWNKNLTLAHLRKQFKKSNE